MFSGRFKSFVHLHYLANAYKAEKPYTKGDDSFGVH